MIITGLILKSISKDIKKFFILLLTTMIKEMKFLKDCVDGTL
jgi:hypothetical protein